MRRLVPFVLLAIVLAGCSEDSAPSSEPTASRGEDDLTSLLRALYDPDGRFAHVDGFVSMRSQSELTLPNGTKATMRSSFVRGADGATLDVNEGWGPIPGMSILCTASASYVRVGLRDLETRWPPGQPCGSGAIQSGPPRDVDNYTFVDVSATDAGGVESAWSFEPLGLMRLASDDAGRIVRAQLDASGSSTTFLFEYGTREALPVPQAAARLPTDLEATQERDDQAVLWTIQRTDDRALLSDLRLFVLDAGEGANLAAFELRPGEQSANGFVLEFRDVDADGRASAGDGARLSRADGGALGALELDLYDEWAKRRASERDAMLQEALAGG